MNNVIANAPVCEPLQDKLELKFLILYWIPKSSVSLLIHPATCTWPWAQHLPDLPGEPVLLIGVVCREPVPAGRLPLTLAWHVLRRGHERGRYQSLVAVHGRRAQSGQRLPSQVALGLRAAEPKQPHLFAPPPSVRERE
jgi:hypothetical protein